jgi:hypothetical protein
MVKPITDAFVITAEKRRLRRNPLSLAGKKLDTKESHTVICVASRVYTPVR